MQRREYIDIYIFSLNASPTNTHCKAGVLGHNINPDGRTEHLKVIWEKN